MRCASRTACWSLQCPFQVQQFAYFITDLLLLCGMCGIYLTRSHRLGLAGFTGFVVFWIGIFMVRSSTLSLFGYSAYLIGATVTLLGAVALGAELLLREVFPRWAPVLWIAALFLGMFGLRPAWAGWSVTLAGVVFGLGFIAAGASLLMEAGYSLAALRRTLEEDTLHPRCATCLQGGPSCPRTTKRSTPPGAGP